MSTKLEQKIRLHRAVEALYHEEENGWWAVLRNGWINGESLCHSVRENSLWGLWQTLQTSVRRKREGDPT